METNIILAGVGGQGIIAISQVIDMAAADQGLNFKQAEVHGMSQRGGAVQSHLRVSDGPIHSDLVPTGKATLILAVEPLEALRYAGALSPDGVVVTSTDPFVNIPDYPDIHQVLDGIATLAKHVLIPSDKLARGAGSGRAQNMVLLGAASPYLGLREELLVKGIRKLFEAKGEKIQKVNVDAFHAGRDAGHAYLACLAAGLSSLQARTLIARVAGGALAADAIPLWKSLFGSPIGSTLLQTLAGDTVGKVAGVADVPRAIQAAGPAAHDKLPSLLFQA